ncbi:MAG: HD-GYP domain-containing protein [Selenomonadaceae bacterium]|nr:HD-GYP domain-containing protein [Selenomonadaceae bacterium]
MLRIPVKKLKAGMVVSQSIYNKTGGSYLVKGQPLTAQYIQKLKKIGIPSVSVTSTNPNFKLAPPADIVQETTRVNAIQRIFDAFQDVENSGRLDVDAVQNVSDHILLDVIQRKENLVQLTDIRLHDTYTFAHSVNVAILSAMLGLLCHYTKQDLALLTLGALLHDLGKIKVSSNILNKTSRLNNEEFSIIQNHPMEGARRIHEMGNLLPSPAILAAIAAQHHEHIDGKGYPQHLTGDQIHRFAKIVAIADVYDALTSERPYKKAYTPSITHNIMVNVNKGQFDTNLLKLFFNNVAIYPVGTLLKTVYGFGIVTKCEFGRTETPCVCIFANTEGKMLEDPVRIDLKNDGPRAIEMEISGIELMHFIHELGVDPTMYLTEE